LNPTKIGDGSRDLISFSLKASKATKGANSMRSSFSAWKQRSSGRRKTSTPSLFG